MWDRWAPNPAAGFHGAIDGGLNSDVPVDDNNVKHDDDEDAGVAVVSAGSATGVAVVTAIAGTAGEDVDVFRRFLRDFGCVTEAVVDGGS